MPDARSDRQSKHVLFGLRARILLVTMLPLLLASLTLAAFFSYLGLREIERDVQHVGRHLASQLAVAVARDLQYGQTACTQRLLEHEQVLHDAPAIGVRDARGAWWLVRGDTGLLQHRPAPPGQSNGLLHFRQPVYAAATPGTSPERLGEVTVVLRSTRIERATAEIIIATFSLMSLLVIPAGLLAWRLSTRLGTPLADVLDTLRALQGGDTGARVAPSTSGELRELEQGVNHLAERIEAHAAELELRIREATAGLIEQKHAADTATIAKSRFLAAASHDLRQPLHTLTLLAGALRERLQESDAESSRLTQAIESSASTMGTLLNALLDISRLDAGIVVARPECFPVMDVLDNISLQFLPVAQDKGLDLRVHASDLTVFSDPVLLERVLANLVANAIRYTERGGVLVGVRRVQKDWARIEVWDTGPGIAPEFQTRVFDEFFQIDDRERGYGKGLGLGLSIVRRLVDLLGSGVGLKSAPGQGSCFSVRAIRCELPPGWRRRGSDTAAMIGHLPTVAFIDDDTRVLEAMLTLFDEWGMEAAVGEEAEQVCAEMLRMQRRPDIILSDYRLAQGRTGIDAIRLLRATFGDRIPAVLVTGETGADTMRIIDASGIPVLHKPLKPARLRAMIAHLLQPQADVAPPA